MRCHRSEIGLTDPYYKNAEMYSGTNALLLFILIFIWSRAVASEGVRLRTEALEDQKSPGRLD